MNKAGEFIITWVAHQDNDVITSPDLPDSYGIYYRVFNPDGTAQTAVDCQANQVVTTGSGLLAGSIGSLRRAISCIPSVSMDADGDFVITWDGNGSERAGNHGSDEVHRQRPAGRVGSHLPCHAERLQQHSGHHHGIPRQFHD